MTPIICSNNVEIVLNSIRAYLTHDEIKDLVLVESNNEQVVFLVDSKAIPEDAAQIWWAGYSEGLKVALNV